MSRVFLIVLLLLPFPAGSFAREAEVSNFALPASTPKTGALRSDSSHETADILAAMRWYFHTTRAPAPRDANHKNILRPCPSAQYVPAPWLALAAERRRLRHHAAIEQVACEVGLPAHLLDALVGQESAYHATALSKSGAAGLTQLMPATARRLGVTQPFDPWHNLRGGARYLRQQIDRFKRVDLALAAYNAGPERKSLARGRIPAIRETQDYVRSVIERWEKLAKGGSVGAAFHRNQNRTLLQCAGCLPHCRGDLQNIRKSSCGADFPRAHQD